MPTGYCKRMNLALSSRLASSETVSVMHFAAQNIEGSTLSEGCGGGKADEIFISDPVDCTTRVQHTAGPHSSGFFSGKDVLILVPDEHTWCKLIFENLVMELLLSSDICEVALASGKSGSNPDCREQKNGESLWRFNRAPRSRISFRF